MQISIDAARELAEFYLNQCGMSINDAAVITDILLEAELRGRKTHGFIRLPGIRNKYQQSEHTEIQIDKEEAQCIQVNGGNQPGYLVAYRAMELAIGKAKLNGTGIEGIAFNSDGEPTTDPEQALMGSVKPYGGHKGFGLALITQILAGALVNASTIPLPGTNYGLFIIVLNPTIFVTSEHFKNEVDSLINRIKDSRHEPNVDEILIPGERAYQQREINLKSGINLDKELVIQLTESVT